MLGLLYSLGMGSLYSSKRMFLFCGIAIKHRCGHQLRFQHFWRKSVGIVRGVGCNEGQGLYTLEDIWLEGGFRVFVLIISIPDLSCNPERFEFTKD